MKSIFTVLFLFVLQIFSAQDEAYANGVFSFENNKAQKIFTDWTRVRKEPNVNSQIVDSLKTNQSILILKKEETILALGERAANWYEISYQKDAQTSNIFGVEICAWAIEIKMDLIFFLEFQKQLISKIKSLIKITNRILQPLKF